MIARGINDPIGRCLQCGKDVAHGDLEEREAQLWTSCCNAPHAPGEPAVKLVDLLGPAWRTFVPVPAALLAVRDLSTGAKVVAAVLLDYVRFEEAFPAQRTLARSTGMDEKSVRRALAELEARGWLTRARRTHRSGARASDSFDVRRLVEALNVLTGEAPVRTDLPGESPPSLPGESPGTPGGDSPDYLEVRRDLDHVGPRRASALRADGHHEREDAW